MGLRRTGGVDGQTSGQSYGHDLRDFVLAASGEPIRSVAARERRVSGSSIAIESSAVQIDRLPHFQSCGHEAAG
jgi:hypothetical protein